MKEIHLGRVLSENRRRKGITQDELAEFIGVSKAAVSKWETENTYPDILLLPRLASYFDISIDELMGYEPQMDREEIRKTHRMLSEEFASLSFEEALEHCRKYAREYSSCYPLVFQIGSLMVNHVMMAQTSEAGEQMIKEAAQLFRRVREGTDDPGLGKEALHMDELHPGIMMPCYIDMAQGWTVLGDKERALECLEKYTDIAVGEIYPLRLHGDAYFDLLDEWFDSTLELGDYPPRDELLIRRSMTQALTENPAFTPLADDPRFQIMAERLKRNEKQGRTMGN